MKKRKSGESLKDKISSEGGREYEKEEERGEFKRQRKERGKLNVYVQNMGEK